MYPDVYKSKPFFLFPQPVLTYSPQPQFFNLQNFCPYQYQSPYLDNQLNLSNSLQYNTKRDINDFVDFRQNFPLNLPRKEFNDKTGLNANVLQPKHEIDNHKDNSNNSNFIFVDFSNIKRLPSQEILSLEELRKPTRKSKRWTKEEDQSLLELKKNPELSWREIASKFPGRTLSACQFRINRLKNMKKKTVKEKKPDVII